MNNLKDNVAVHYGDAAAIYHEQYERDTVHDITKEYPANYFRLQQLLNAFTQKGIKRVIEVGVGEGTPLSTLGKAGIDVWGFDLAPAMVEKSKLTVQRHGMNPDQIFWGDIQDPTSYIHALKQGAFDGLMAMGVMPHVENDDLVLSNMAALVRPGGSVFIEFRNKLFSLFTFNRHTVDFIIEDLLRDVNPALKDAVAKDLRSRLRVDSPPVREKIVGHDGLGFDMILAKFHNPFEVIDLFKRHGFQDMKYHWYHYHPAMPYLEGGMKEEFRRASVSLEHEASGWRGFFLCSAFVIEAVKGA
ncbi:MAG: methyltransferase domain-containing protein [Pseudomonadota bacterium]